MVWRGGDRFARCLKSIEESERFFSRVVISVTGDAHGSDMELARAAQSRCPRLEVLCTGTEWPTMQHQAFWVDYLAESGARADDWVCWLAYDDELLHRGLVSITNASGDWPLRNRTAYFGPWAMRGEEPDCLWNGDSNVPIEVWTSFPAHGPTRLPVAQWIGDQLKQPTYMQMSGSVNPFQSFLDLRWKRPRKRGPMRIEMATASVAGILTVEEFDEPICVIYTRSDSDRASYGPSARSEDRHLAFWLVRYLLRHPRSALRLIGAMIRSGTRGFAQSVGLSQPPGEEWRVRSTIDPS